ncbi:DUF881 domain-containing protein [Aeromicrobium sp. CF4.19]|uniref:DUF881 domain-containing protein n=1 Tax=Aeromicrobium sp. CF4.19 TaxID=3373082 RepID=UPI003EE78B84
MSARRPAESLLDEVAETALDDDYYVVRAGEPVREHSANTIMVGLVMVLFAALVTVAAMQSADDRPFRQLERSALIDDVAGARAAMDQAQQRRSELESEVTALGAGPLESGQGDDRPLVAGLAAVTGPGLVVTVEDAAQPDGPEGRVSAADLRILVNELWYAGAEAVAVGEQRLSARSAITAVDGVPQANYRPLASPFRIVAIGDTSTLQDRLESGGAGRYLRERTSADGLSLRVTSSDDVALPAAPRGQATLDHAEALEVDR